MSTHYKKTSSLSRVLIIFSVLFVVGCMVAIGYFSSKPNTINSRAAMICVEKDDCPAGKVCKNGKCKVPEDYSPCNSGCTSIPSSCPNGVDKYRSCIQDPQNPTRKRYCCK